MITVNGPVTASPVAATTLLDEAAALLDPDHIAAVTRILVTAGWGEVDAREAVTDALAGSLVVAAEDDESSKEPDVHNEDFPPIVAPIALDRLLGMLPFDPYADAPWIDCAPLNVAEVLSCNLPNPGRLSGELFYPRAVHTARVAWLVRNWANDGTDPVSVEVFGHVIVHDGCHRIAAAIARQDPVIYADLGGDLVEAYDRGFGVRPFLDADQLAQLV